VGVQHFIIERFVFCTCAIRYEDGQMKLDQIAGKCSMHGREETYVRNFGRKTLSKENTCRFQM
jgi:hypothetical protein